MKYLKMSPRQMLSLLVSGSLSIKTLNNFIPTKKQVCQYTTTPHQPDDMVKFIPSPAVGANIW